MRQYMRLIHGIPSKNTIARLFYSLNPDSFKACFIAWVKSLQTTLNEVIAIDGKTLCNSINTIENIPAIHMVSAFATKAIVMKKLMLVTEGLNFGSVLLAAKLIG